MWITDQRNALDSNYICDHILTAFEIHNRQIFIFFHHISEVLFEQMIHINLIDRRILWFKRHDQVHARIDSVIQKGSHLA